MKNFYSQIKNFLNIALFLGIFLQSYLANAQTTLGVGDIAFTGYDSTPPTAGNDSFSFVLLTNISAGTIISFTDRGYTGSGWFATSAGEGCITWTSGSAIPLGTEILITGLTASTYSPSTSTATPNGTVTLTQAGTAGKGLILSNVGDQIIAFQGGSGIISNGGVTIIAGITYLECGAQTSTATWDVPDNLGGDCQIGPNSSAMPPGLTGGTNAFYTGTISGGNTPQSSKYNGTGTPFTTAAQIRAAVMNQANWTLSTTTLTMPSGAFFLGVPPAITGNPPNRTICNNGTTTFNVTATNATGYQWQVNTGSGFTNITNGAPYSGATSATLTITGATASMNGYTYRAVASGAGTATSNSATLTVVTTTVTTTAQSNVSCFGGANGTATIAASGGITPYTYSWSPSGGTGATATGLSAGTYTVTVTDNLGCPTTHNVIITQPATALNGTISTTSVSCFGGGNGTATVTPSGGTSGYTYLWSNGNTNATATGLAAGTYSVTVTDANACPRTFTGIVIGQPAAALDGTATTTAVSCFGGANGTATVSATGGTLGYTYSWSPSGGTLATATGLTAGTYSVTITDANACQKIVTGIVVGQPAAVLNGTISTTSVSCFGGANGTATITPSGGTPGYTYLWSNGATTATTTGLVAGTYSVTITDANACPRTFTGIVIGQPAAALNGTISTTAVSCFGGGNGTATVTPSGGTPGYTYLWSNGATTATITGLVAGTYSVTVTDNNGCPRIFTGISIGQPAAALNGTATTTAVSCFGGANGTATVTPLGGTPGYTYLWSNGATTATITGLAAGTYSVAITDNNGCPRTITGIVVGQPAAAVDGTATSTAVSCFGGANGTATVTATGGTVGYTYSWAPFGGTAATATGLTAGTYSVTITDANACQKTITGIVVGQPAAILSGTTATTAVSCNGGANGTATATGVGGTPGYTYLWSNGATTATITGLAAGIYSVTITDANSCATIINNIIITQPPVLNANISTTSVSCFGGANGTATAAPFGGASGYTYLWSNGATTATTTGLAAGIYSVVITDNNLCDRTINNIIIGQPASAVDGTTSTTSVSCFGGSNGTATVTPSGGTPGYTYSWAPFGGTAATATGLSAGTYSVTITDANACQKTITGIVVGQAAASVDGTATTTSVSCFGGSNGTATVTAFGGVPGYTYSWSPTGGTGATATGLTAGTYSVTITDANSCQRTISGIVVGQPAAVLDGTASTTLVSCFGGTDGTATVTATGGTSAYTYLWSNGAVTATASGLAAGTYSVTITDANACSKIINNIVVGQPTVITPNPSQVNVSCNGGNNGSATVTPTGGTGIYTYLWSNGAATAAINGLSAGTYSVTITDANSCVTLQSFTIAQPTVLVASEDVKTNVSCNGGANGTATVAVTGGITPYTYSWAPSGGTAAAASGLAAGTYTVTVTDGNGCTTTQSFNITEPTALTVSSTQTNVNCFGDATGSASVTVSGATAPYTYSWSPAGGTAATATGLTAGTYTVTITDDNGCTATETVTITQPATALTASAGPITNVNCFGNATGSATVNVTGGTGSYTYLWAPSGGTAATATGLTAGTYVVTVTDDNLCQTTQSFTITQPAAPLSATTAATNVSCFGGSNGTASVTVSGGTSGYTYAWAPSGGTASTATGLAAGNYSVTITDANGCQLIENITIGSPTQFSTSVSKTDVSCNGGSNGSATVTVTGATAPYTYSWSPTGGTAATASGLSAGTYVVTITDNNGCSTTNSVTISEPTILTAVTTHVDVTCIGRTDGSATVTPTGGTGSYTYSWAPTGGTSATATGLAAGTYVVTVTDANGCLTTKSVTISTTPDITAPVPDVTNLPDITNFCSVLSSQITIPTASDYCAGTVTATTTSPLNYTAEGTYVITWSYNDGNGNISTQNQNVKVLASPLNQVTFTGATYTYNGNAQTVQVANLPAGATVVYTTSPATGTPNGAVNAGIYTVTAVVSPATTSPNCSPITLTAQLTINKAAQQITFAPLGIKTLGTQNTFNLTASSSSNLPISYTYTFTTPLPAATVTAAGVVTMLKPGEITITANQSGNANYLPATSVSQLLVIKNNDVTITKITLGNKVFTNPAKNLYYLMECGENNVNVAFVNETNATFSPSANLTVNTPKAGIYTQNVTVTSEDGSTTATYVITVEKPFGFYDIVQQKFNNVLLVNNNPQTNGGYEFVAYQWFKNGQVIGTNQYFSAGDVLSNTLDLNADYSVKMTTKDGKVLQTCSTKLQAQNSLQVKLYPNPVETGKIITVDADLPQSDLDNMQISLYSVTGQLITTVKSSTAQTQIQLPPTTESNMYLVVLESGSIKKSFKVIVK